MSDQFSSPLPNNLGIFDFLQMEAGFSAHGHRPQTLVALASQAPAGLTAAELGQRLRLDPRSFLWQFHQHPGLQRQKHQGRFVYLAADPRQAKAQMAQRAQPKASPVLPAAAEAVVILVAAIKHPRWSPERLGASLRASDPQLTPGGGCGHSSPTTA